MRNREVCEEFIRKNTATGSNLTSTGSKLLSYATCIAQWAKIDFQEVLFINKTRYSNITSKHQSYLNRSIVIPTKVIHVIDVPRGIVNLVDYYYEHQRR